MDNYFTMSRSSATERCDMSHCDSRFFYTLRTANVFQFLDADLSESPTTIPEFDLLLLLLVLPQERGFEKGLYTVRLHRSVIHLWLWTSLCIKLWLVLGGWGGPEINAFFILQGLLPEEKVGDQACSTGAWVLPERQCECEVGPARKQQKRPCPAGGVVRVGICTRRHFIRVLNN